MRGRISVGGVVVGAACGPLPSVDLRSAGEGLYARAVAAPPFSGPRSRGNVEACNTKPHQRGFALLVLKTPRIGPGTGGTTTALLHTTVACHACACHLGAGVGGLGCGRRPPFAVASTCAREHRVDGSTRAGQIRCPASVGPENVPRATCPRATSARTTRRATATRQKRTLVSMASCIAGRVKRSGVTDVSADSPCS